MIAECLHLPKWLFVTVKTFYQIFCGDNPAKILENTLKCVKTLLKDSYTVFAEINAHPEICAHQKQ